MIKVKILRCGSYPDHLGGLNVITGFLTSERGQQETQCPSDAAQARPGHLLLMEEKPRNTGNP